MRAEIQAAQKQLFAAHGDFLRVTPMLRVSAKALNAGNGELWLKCEHMQVSGSFKARGMLNRLASNAIPAAGVIVASGGNAGIATAAAARHLGVPCEVFLPTVSSPAKRSRLAALGATVTVVGAAYADALAACLARQAHTGALLTHAYDQIEVVQGAGTLGAEIEDQIGVPDHLLVSVGGGGLIGGLAAWFEDRCVAHALEPELAPTLHAARCQHEPVDVAVSGIAADSLGAKRIGTLGWQITQQWVKHAHLLHDAAIIHAQKTLWAELRLAVEPAAALPLAALQTGAVRLNAGESACLVICGANVDLVTLAV